MDNKNKPINLDDLENSNYKLEIQLGILGIIASLGFFKIDELTSFISILSATFKNIAYVEKGDLLLIFLIVVIIFFYILYFLTFSFALYRLFKGKSIIKIILYTVSFYFAMYFLLIFLMMQDPDIMKNKPDFQTKNNKISNKITNEKADNNVYK